MQAESSSIDRSGANFRGLVVRGNTWFWKEQNLRGNTIDFFMVIEAKTFAQTMEILAQSEPDALCTSTSRPKPNGQGHHDDDVHEDDSLPL